LPDYLAPTTSTFSMKPCTAVSSTFRYSKSRPPVDLIADKSVAL